MVQITPQQIESRLYDLSKELDEAHAELVADEYNYITSKAELEIAMARSRMSNSHPDLKMTVQMREDKATVDNADAIIKLAIAEAKTKASKENVRRVDKQVDIARSISSSIKSSLDL